MPHTEHAKAGKALAVFVIFRFFCVGVDTGSEGLLGVGTESASTGGICTAGAVGVMFKGIMGGLRFRGGRLGLVKVKVDEDGLMLFIE